MGCTLPAIGDLWKFGAGVVPSYFCRREGETNVRFRLTFFGQEASAEYSASSEDELSIFGLLVAGVVRKTAVVLKEATIQAGSGLDRQSRLT